MPGGLSHHRLRFLRAKGGIVRQYQKALEVHLANYKRGRLGVRGSGEFKTKKSVVRRPHILPRDLYLLNILEPFRSEFRLFLQKNPSVKLHEYFHHLNSSQALAFNLFFPFFSEGAEATERLLVAFGVPGQVSEWRFEYVPDEEEGTNVDVAWRVREEGWTFCEVKLSERDFGDAEPDARHERKLKEIYAPRLQGVVDDRLLKLEEFMARYQLLRNVSLLTRPHAGMLVFLLPKENDGPRAALGELLRTVAAPVRKRIRVLYLEDVLNRLREDARLDSRLREHARQLAEKYLLPPEPP